MKFSVLIPVFYRANPIFFRESLDSILEFQSCKPSEVVIIVDGTPTEPLEEIIASYKLAYSNVLKVKILPEHCGTGYALKVGVEHCSNEIIARMDADDIAVYYRFEKQLSFMKNHQNVTVLGGLIEEFSDTQGDLMQYRTVPKSHCDIVQFAKFRCPVNHPTVMFRKSAILAVGNYSKEYLYKEDYQLWVRLLSQGYQFHNMQEVLLHFRFQNKGKGIVKKRSGLRYAISEVKFANFSRKIGFFSFKEYLRYAVFFFFGRLLPNGVLRFFYVNTYRKREP